MEDDSLSEKEKVDFDKNSLLEVLEKNYYFELERRNHIDRKINVPIGIITVLVGSLHYFFQEWKGFIVNSLLLYTYLAILLGLGISIAISIYFHIRAYWGHQYMRMASPSQLYHHYEYTCDYFRNDPHKVSEESIDFILEQYQKSAEHNVKVNDFRLTYYHKGMASIIISIGIGLLLIFLYALSL